MAPAAATVCGERQLAEASILAVGHGPPHRAFLAILYKIALLYGYPYAAKGRILRWVTRPGRLTVP